MRGKKEVGRGEKGEVRMEREDGGREKGRESREWGYKRYEM